MLRQKNFRIILLFISCPLSHLSGNSIDATFKIYPNFKIYPKFNNFPHCQLLPCTKSLLFSALNCCHSSSRCLLSEQQLQGDITHVTPLLKTLLPISFTVKAKVPTVAYWSVPPLNTILAIFSLTLSTPDTLASWVFLEYARKTPTSVLLYELSLWLVCSAPNICKATSFTPCKPLIKYHLLFVVVVAVFIFIGV